MSSIEPNSPEALDLIGQVTKALQDQTAAWEQLAGVLGKNASVFERVVSGNKAMNESSSTTKDALASVTDEMRKQTDGAEGLAGALGRSATASGDARKANEQQIDSIKKLIENFTSLQIAIAAAGEVYNNLKLLGGGALSLLTSGFGMLQAGIGMVMAPFEGLMSMAAQFANERAEEAWAANQKLTASFGDAEGATGSFVKTMKNDLGAAAGSLSKAGNSMWSAIGYGPAVLEEAIKIAEGFGNSLNSLKDQIKGATDEMFLMSRGMNMSADSLKNLAINAKASGGSFEESMQEGMVASAHLANQFGLDVKDIGKNMDIMQKDMATFGHMAPKELAAVAAYSAKLGVSIESLGKTMSAFDTFESAAGNAGKLAEAFGMNVDVMGMMNAENPAERMDMLRKSFEDTGKAVSDLSRHELKLLSESMGGIPVDELKAGLSMSSDELGFGDFADAAEEAAQKVSPEEAMIQVSKSIEKLNKALSKMAGGPLTDFIKGFKHGIMNSKEFKGILSDIGGWLKIFNQAGVEIGQTFSQIFLKDGTKFKNVINAIFNPASAMEFMTTVKKAFGDLFAAFSDPKMDLATAGAKFFDDLMGGFETWTGGTGKSGLMDLLQDMLIGALELLAGIVPKIMTTAAKYIQKFADGLGAFFKDPKGSAVGAVKGGLIGALQQAGAAIMEAWPALKKSLLSLCDVIWQEIKWPLAKVFIALITYSVVKAIITVAASKAVLGAVAWLAKKITGSIGAANKKKVKKSKHMGPAIKNLGQNIRQIAGKGFGSIKEITLAIIKLGLIAGGFALAMVGFAYAIAEIAKVIGPIKWEDLAKTFVVMAVAMGSMYAFAKAAGKIDKKTMVQGGLGLIAGAIFLGVSFYAYAKAIQLVTGVVQGIKFADFLKAAVMIVPAILGTAGLALTGAGLVADGGLGLLLGGVGLVAGAVFLGVVGSVYGLAIGHVVQMMSDIPFVKALQAFTLIGVSLLAVVALAVVGAVVAVASPVMLAASSGIETAAEFLSVSMKAFAEALVVGLKPFDRIDLKKAGVAFLLIQGALVALVEMVAVGTIFTAMDFFGGVSILEKGMKTAAEFAKSSFKEFGSVITELMNIEMGDPAVFVQKMQAMGMLIDATAKIADLGMEAAKMATVASLLGGGEPADMMYQMSVFIATTVGSMTGIVTAFVTMGKDLKPEEIKGINAIAGIVGVIGELAGALMNPLIEMQKNVSIIGVLKGDKASDQMNAMTGGIGTLLSGLTEHLPKMVESLKTCVEGIADPDAFLKKSQALEAMFNGILAMVDAVTKLHAMTQKDIPWYKGGGTETDTSQLTDLFITANDILSHWSLKAMLTTTKELVSSIPAMGDDVAKGFKNGMNATIEAIQSAAMLGDFFAKDGYAGLWGLWNLKDSFESMKKGNYMPSMVIKMIVDEAAEIAGLMSDIDADLGKVHLKPLLDGVLGYNGDKNFTVKAEGVNLTVRLQVAMDAEKLATSIVKGNEDLDGFFSTTEKADKSMLEGDRGAFKWLGNRGG